MNLRTALVCSFVLFGCGPGTSTVGGSGGGSGAGAGAGGGAGAGAGGGSGSACEPTELCGDAVDNDCDGQVDEGFDADGDGALSCKGDCNDNDAAVKPGATEALNQKDDDCDGKVDNKIAGNDFDKDGTPYPQDCNDEEPLVGPLAVEVASDQVDNDCNGQVDEAPASCEDQIGASPLPADYAKAIGLCSNVAGSEFVAGNILARKIRTRFGNAWTPRAGSRMVFFSSGKAVDNNEEPTYSPGIFNSGAEGESFGTRNQHPLYSTPRCGTQPINCGFASSCPTGSRCISGKCIPDANDMTEYKLTLKVPQNAKSFSFQFNFFSAEYPEYVCTRFNDRFIAVLESKGLDPSKLPAGQCLTGTATPTCNVSYDDKGQPVTVNNGFFDVCRDASGSGPPAWTNDCSKEDVATLLAMTGYEKPDSSAGAGQVVGGATGWLTTKAPVVPGETITLRFIVFDEGDHILDSAVAIDNFKWDATPVEKPVTEPPPIN